MCVLIFFFLNFILISLNLFEIIVPMSFSAPNYLNSQGILAKYSDLVISSSNPEVVQVTEEGVATAVAVGSSVVEVKNRYSQEWFKPVSVSCVITVEPYTPAIPTATQVPTAIPTATQVPAVTAMPIVTQVPTATQIPTVTEMPTITQAPTATQVPTITQAPIATQIPTVTLTPVITKKPVVPTNVPESYKINYILNKGKNNQSNPSNYTTKNIKLKAPNRKGYTFEGWYTDKNFTNSIKTIKADAKQDITIYAKWTKVKKPSKPTIKSAVNVKGEKVKVTLKKKVAGAKGYEISCSIDKKWKKSVKTVTSKGITKTITKLKKNKTYYVKVRAYKLDSTGEKVYGSYSKVKKIKIQK